MVIERCNVEQYIVLQSGAITTGTFVLLCVCPSQFVDCSLIHSQNQTPVGPCSVAEIETAVLSELRSSLGLPATWQAAVHASVRPAFTV